MSYAQNAVHHKPTPAVGGKSMNPFIRRMAVVLTLACVFALYTASGVLAALAPEVHHLGRISGVIAPVRLAADPFGKLYVADPRNGGVLQFDNAGNRLKTFPVKGARGVAITPAGELVVTHGSAASVINVETGSLLFPLTPTAPFKQANGVTVDDAGRILVVDTLDSTVKVFLGSGQPSISFGNAGAVTEKLNLPTAIAFDSASKQIIVADTGNSRLVFFDKNGVFIRSVGGKTQNGTAPVFTSPQSVALEYTKTSPQNLQRIYVSDSFQSEVQIIDPQGPGSSLSRIGGYGKTAGKLKVPVDALFDAASSRLLVANGAGEITLFGINVTALPAPDTTPPVLTLDAPPAIINTNTVVIGGSVEKEALVQISVPSGVSVSAVSYFPAPDASLSFWQAEISGLIQGQNTLTVIARDTASNPATATATIIYSPDNSVKVGIDTTFSVPVNKVQQALSGTKTEGSTVSLTGPAGVTFITTNSPTTWSSTASGLTEGINTITATAVNGAFSSSASTRITVLTSGPSLEVSTLADKSTTTQPVLNVSGRLSNNSYFAALTVNGEPVEVHNDAFSTSVTLKVGVNGGANIISIIARDTAGNETKDIRTITFDDTLPTVAISAPADGAIVSGTSIHITGTVTKGATVQLHINNGSAFPVETKADGSWSATSVPLDPGLNTLIVSIAGTGSSAKATVTRDAGVPSLAVTIPEKDISLNKPTQTVSGTVSAGSEIKVTINGVDVPVTVKPDGTYSIPVTFEAEKPYALVITATDALGKSVTTYRNLVYDVTAPAIKPIDPATPLKITFSEGIPAVVDKNGPVAGVVITTNADGSKTVDLSNATFDLMTLDVHAVDAAGNSTRNGDVDGNRTTDIADAMKMLRLSLGLDVASFDQKLRGDVAPLLNGISKPDGLLNVFDIIFLLEKIVGLR
jgi:hypothetical protein